LSWFLTLLVVLKSGVFQYALLGGKSAKVIAAFHGSFEADALPPLAGNITGYTMILSGGNDGQHGNQTLVESILNEGNAEWEISRWSNVDHGFTVWESDAYNLRADYRSWSAFLTAVRDKMPVPLEVGSVAASPVAASPVAASPVAASPDAASPVAASPVAPDTTPTKAPITDAPDDTPTAVQTASAGASAGASASLFVAVFGLAGVVIF
jgi:Dienelactone hydrolase family